MWLLERKGKASRFTLRLPETDLVSGGRSIKNNLVRDIPYCLCSEYLFYVADFIFRLSCRPVKALNYLIARGFIISLQKKEKWNMMISERYLEKYTRRRMHMKNVSKYIVRILYSYFLFLMANNCVFAKNGETFLTGIVLVLVFAWINIKPAFYTGKLKSRKLKSCQNGCELLVLFLISVCSGVLFQIAGILGKITLFHKMNRWQDWVLDILLLITVESILFWNGMIRIYVNSAQLGMKWRIIGAACGWIPIVNLIVLHKLLRIVTAEVKTENEKLVLNEVRSAEKICATKYPILMVHGVFFRDFRYFNYWGRIPKELEKNGAVIYYGGHQSAASVEESGKELAERIQEIVKETGCEKVNIIAHSKGGLDCRYALSKLDVGKMTASLTTINTPHRGCEFADYLLSKIPENQKQAVACAYNAALKKLGDFKPDFLAAVGDLTAEACRRFNQNIKDVSGVFYQSVGSGMRVARGGRFPLNLTNRFVKFFDGENDGLVGNDSFPWGEKYEYLAIAGNRGISHGDMIDLNRENLPEFDVREFYVQLVKDLKERGF